MNYVAQEHPSGCLVACIAMIAGMSFAEAMEVARPAFNDGLNDFIVDDILADLGFAVMTRWRHAPSKKADRLIWPVAPFAPAHIIGARVAAGFHGAVMLADGSVLDPWKRERTTLAHPDYLDVYRVSGYWKVA